MVRPPCVTQAPRLDTILDVQGVPVAGLLDIAAMKLIAVSQRGAKRDFVDLYFILQEVPFHRVCGTLAARYERGRINPINIGKSLVYFKDADDDPEPLYMGEKRPSWVKIKSFFRLHIRQMVLDLHAALNQPKNL